MDKIKTDIEIGRQIFDNVPGFVRPVWGSLILSLFDSYLDKVPTEIVGLYNIIEDSNDWKNAHEQFTAIRKLNLKNSGKEFELYLCLAECIAKITYNESGQSAPFDSDSGYYIPRLALMYAYTIED